MGFIDITAAYRDGEALLEADLDAIQSSLLTFFNTDKVSSDSIQINGITGSSKLVNASVTTSKIQNATVTSSKIAPSAITTAKIIDLAVTTDKIATSAVTTSKIATGSLTNANFANASVTAVKLVPSNIAVGSTAISYTSVGTSEETVTNATVTIVGTGKPIWVGLQATASATGYVQINSRTSVADELIRIYRDSTLIYEVNMRLQNSVDSMSLQYPPCLFWVIDSGAGAASYTYTIKVVASAAGGIAVLGSPKMYAFEIT